LERLEAKLRAVVDDEADEEPMGRREWLKKQDLAFQQAMMDAIAAGAECCPTQISTAPGTVRPVTGYVRPD